MPHLVLRVRPDGLVSDLDLEQLRRRLARLDGWTSELRDTRLSDAPYVTVIAGTAELDEAAGVALRHALSDLDGMHVEVWLGIGSETALARCDLPVLKAAAEAFERIGNGS